MPEVQQMGDERLAGEGGEADNCWFELLARTQRGLPGASLLAGDGSAPGKGPQNGMFWGQQV